MLVKLLVLALASLAVAQVPEHKSQYNRVNPGNGAAALSNEPTKETGVPAKPATETGACTCAGAASGTQAAEADARDSNNAAMSQDTPSSEHLNIDYDFDKTSPSVQVSKASGQKTQTLEESTMADMFRLIRQTMEERYGKEVVDAMIQVPPFLDDLQIRTTENAAKLAGLNVIDISKEPIPRPDVTKPQTKIGLYHNAKLKVTFDLGNGFVTEPIAFN